MDQEWRRINKGFENTATGNRHQDKRLKPPKPQNCSTAADPNELKVVLFQHSLQECQSSYLVELFIIIQRFVSLS